jgi:hypothetical protein
VGSLRRRPTGQARRHDAHREITLVVAGGTQAAVSLSAVRDVWLAFSALCCYAAEAFFPVFVFLAPHTFWQLAQWFAVPAAHSFEALVAWAARTARSASDESDTADD